MCKRRENYDHTHNGISYIPKYIKSINEKKNQRSQQAENLGLNAFYLRNATNKNNAWSIKKQMIGSR